MSLRDRQLMCNICKVLISSSNLKRHIRSKHGLATTDREKEPSEPLSNPDDDVVCKFCKKIFKRRNALLQHYRTVHTNDPGVLSECAWVETYSCQLCDYKTARKHTLNYHITRTHVNPPIHAAVSFVKCPMCEFENTREIMLEHYQSAHNVTLTYETLDFESESSFNDWKSKTEEDNCCKFSRTDSYKFADGRVKILYRCQRDGIYRAKGRNARRPKGSSKMNGCCPASLRLEINPDGKTKVSFCRTHVGHSGNAVHIRLTKAERDEIAKKIADGLSFDEVIDLFRTEKNKLKRKDLHNIVRDYSLLKEDNSKDDSVTVELWVREMLVLDNVIRFYKPLGEVLNDYPHLDPNDLIMVVINDAQVDMARRHAANVICACSTGGVGISLSTISILDELGRSVPVAFMLANNSSYHIADILVECFKEAVGYRLKPRILLTDVDENFSTSWNKHMIEPEFRLYCRCCVDESLGKNLAKLKKKQIDVQGNINLLFEERSEANFSTLIKMALNNWNSQSDTKSLGSYFEENFAKYPSRWASCFQVPELDHTPFQTLHRRLRQMLLNAKLKRLDLTFVALMQFLREILLEGLARLSERDAFPRLQPIKSRHEAAVLIAPDRIIKDGDLWKVYLSNSSNFYEVRKSIDCNCGVKCYPCKACIHSYTCSCPDSAYKFNFCKHIHAVCQHVLQNSSAVKEVQESEVLNDDFLLINQEPSTLPETVRNGNDPTADIDQEKKQLILEFSAIVSRADSAERVKFLRKSLDLLSRSVSCDFDSSTPEESGSKVIYVAVPTVSPLAEENRRNSSDCVKLLIQNGAQLPNRTFEGIETCFVTYVPLSK